MGRDKALVEVDGRPMAAAVASALRAAGAARVVAVGGDAPRLAGLGIEVVPDEHPGAGPLGGVLTALRTARTASVVVLACDLTCPSPEAVARVLDGLTAGSGAAVAWPEDGGRAQVLHAAWDVRTALPVLATAFAAGERSLRRAAAGLPRAVVTGIAPGSLHDADRPEDIPPAVAGG
jgi:molybdopterin-guanine dinucleotide biosynthesis protein A